ncbi:hypothetical protein APASM_3274 [Actinosynnema pretiosum subsp. pretiosum]|nr:hypothetical protein APASM_3274 [Actinosynnema pretiosum subsp. pretiosum]
MLGAGLPLRWVGSLFFGGAPKQMIALAVAMFASLIVSVAL